MGGPRRFKKRYEAPKKLWIMDRLKKEKGLRTEYGLKNSREIWVANAELKKYRAEARRLLSLSEEERKKDIEVIFKKIHKYGILEKSNQLEDILSLDIQEILERRLQTRVLRKGIAKSIRQARQLISHGFIAIGDRVVTVPGYLVTAEDDAKMRLAKPIDLEVKVAEEQEKAEEKKPQENNGPQIAA